MFTHFEPATGRTLLLAATAALALAAGTNAMAAAPQAAFSGGKVSATAKPCAIGVCWWDQNQAANYDGYAIDSQNFTSGTYAAYDDAAADDFLVSGTTQTVSGVDVSGQYFNGAGPATSVNVTFYSNISTPYNQPGAILYTFTDQPYVDPNGTGSFQIDLCKWNAKHTKCKPTRVKFKKGVKKQPAEYWVSVVANCSFATCGEWGWDMRNPVAGLSAAEFEGFNSTCPTWDYMSVCPGGLPQDDLMFDLRQ